MSVGAATRLKTRPPSLDFSKFVEAKHRIKPRKAPGRGGLPRELLATWGPVADAIVYALCVRRINGEKTHAERVGLGVSRPFRNPGGFWSS